LTSPAASIDPSQRKCAVKKLKLNIEELEVASFEVPAETETPGTVQGQLMLVGTYADCSWHCTDPFSTLWYYTTPI
jgi:hypothetical protein